MRDPYFQHFTGEAFFQHRIAHERSGLSHWRGRLGEKLELLLAESLRVAHATGALKARDMERVTVDTTVQPKNVTHPTDTKLMHKAIVMLGALARKHGVKLRQSYVRVPLHFSGSVASVRPFPFWSPACQVGSRLGPKAKRLFWRNQDAPKKVHRLLIT